MGWIADADLQALLLPDHTLPAPALAAYTTGITYGTARCTLYLYSSCFYFKRDYTYRFSAFASSFHSIAPVGHVQNSGANFKI